MKQLLTFLDIVQVFMGASVGVISSLDGQTETTADGVVILPFPKNGVTLSYIGEFFEACGGRAKLEGLTTTEVNEKHVKPVTAPVPVIVLRHADEATTSCRRGCNCFHFARLEVCILGSYRRAATSLQR